MPRRGSPYGGTYGRRRRSLLGLPCELRLVCAGARADSADHDPPLAVHVHVEGSGCCRLRPACSRCQDEQGRRLASGRYRWRAPRLTPEASREW